MHNAYALDHPPPGRPRRALSRGALALAYVGSWVGLWHLAGLMNVAPGASAWYPPAALTFALLAWGGPRLLVLPLGASLIAGHGLWAGAWWVHEVLGSLSHVASYALAAALYRRFAGVYRVTPRTRSLVALVAAGALGAVLSALLGSLNHAVAEDAVTRISGASVVAWAAGDLLAVVTLAPGLLYLAPAVARRGRALSGLRPRRMVRGVVGPVAALLALAAAGWSLGTLAEVDPHTIALILAGTGLVFLAGDLPPGHAAAALVPAGAAGAIWIGSDPSPQARIEHAVLLACFTICALGALARAQHARRQRAAGLHLRTRLKALDQATRRAQRGFARVEQRIAEAGHELRTPLNAVIGYAELAELRGREVLQDAKTVDYAATVADSGRHLLVLLNDIVDAATLRQGTFRPHLATVDAGETIASVARMCRYRAEAKGQALRVDTPDRPARCRADATRLRQVLTNLTINAVKYAPANSTIDLSAGARADGIEIVVRDRGPGMSDGELAVALARYGRLPADDGEEGTGLGLPLALRLVEEMGGRSEIDTHPGSGTAFHLVFPPADGGETGEPPQAPGRDAGA